MNANSDPKKKSFLTKNYQLGNITLPNNIFYAPLAGCSDYPFRKMSRSNAVNPGLIFCEMVRLDALVRYDRNTLHMLDYSPDMHPIGGQLCGSKPSLAGPAAKIIEELGFDVVDLNCGCPVDNVTKDGSGSGLLKNPHLIGEMISNMVAAVKIPVTVKIRAGWDDTSIIAAEVTKIAEEAGAASICIHGRTREQAYRGAANWDHIKACKEVAKKIKVVGNGDIFDPNAAQKIFEHTGCDAILVARGTMGQPWIAQEIMSQLEGDQPNQYSLEDCRSALLRHFEFIRGYHHHPHKAILDMRRVGCWYLKKSSGTKAFREKMARVKSLDEIVDLIHNFPLGEVVKEEGLEEQEVCC